MKIITTFLHADTRQSIEGSVEINKINFGIENMAELKEIPSKIVALAINVV